MSIPVQKTIRQADGRDFHDVEFSTSPCDGCGVCCRHYRVSFYHGEAGEKHWQVPVGLVHELTPVMVCMKGTEKGFGRCVALGEDGRCTIYSARPSPCREYPLFVEDGSLNPECVRLRNLYNIH